MNPTIEKIVGLLFEDLAPTDEVTAIREEVLQNCQERYQDLREAGISEDDAISAVIESLSGMEEMLSEYPRREDVPAEDAPQEAPAEQPACEPCWQCDPRSTSVREICVEHIGSADVNVCVSQDHLLHVECSNPELTLHTGLENGVLTISLSEQNTDEEIRFSLQEGFDLSSLGKMFSKFTRRFISANWKATGITLAIPSSLSPVLKIGAASGNVTVEPMGLHTLRIGTASGDVELDNVTLTADLRVTSASGNITITSVQARQMRLSSTSGDIEAGDCITKESVKLNTTSGDISWSKECQSLEATSISGDITLEGEAESITFRTVSGDSELNLRGSRLLSVTGSNTSGDASIHLPAGAQADVNCSTVSGDIKNLAGSVPGAVPTLKISTVSGDIDIHRNLFA